MGSPLVEDFSAAGKLVGGNPFDTDTSMDALGPQSQQLSKPMSLRTLGFTGSAEGLRPSVKHRERAMNWKEPTNREELDAIIWITPFLRMFIPGRAEHVISLKKAYLKEEAIKLESGNEKSIRKNG